MSEITIDRHKLNYVVKYMLNTAEHSARDLHPIEVVLALSECIGRIIAVQNGTQLLHNDMLAMAKNHMDNTVKAGYAAAGKNPEALQ